MPWPTLNMVCLNLLCYRSRLKTAQTPHTHVSFDEGSYFHGCQCPPMSANVCWRPPMNEQTTPPYHRLEYCLAIRMCWPCSPANSQQQLMLPVSVVLMASFMAGNHLHTGQHQRPPDMNQNIITCSTRSPRCQCPEILQPRICASDHWQEVPQFRGRRTRRFRAQNSLQNQVLIK